MATSKHRKRLFIGLSVAAVAVLTVSAILLLRQHQSSPSTSSANHRAITRSDTNDSAKTQGGTHKTIRLIATGDMLPHDTVNQAARSGGGYDYLPMFGSVKDYLKDTDLSYCNQESPSAEQFAVSGYPTFNAPQQFAKDLSSLGCNVINLANNHANDKGQSGISATRALWSSLPHKVIAGTARSATEQREVGTFTQDGVTFAFLSYTKCSNSKLTTAYGVNTLSKPLVDQQIAAAKKQGAQVLIVATHWCHENVSNEDSDQDMWAQYFASKGVDIVIGTGPHWLQPVKQLPKAGGGKTLVWFSLGNFLSTQLEVNGLIGGIAVMSIDVRSHQIVKVGFLPVYMHYEWTAAQAKSGDLLARHNLQLYPLDQAAAALARSQNHTTIPAQTQRVTKLLNMYTDVTMLTSKTYHSFGR